MRPSSLMKFGALALVGLVLVGAVVVWAKQKPVSYTEVNPAIEPIEPEMVTIPAGCFIMGDDEHGLETEKPEREVCLSEYRIGKYEVTCEEYLRFCEATDRPCPRDPDFIEDSPQFMDYCKKYPRYPVIMVSWTEAAAYAKWLSDRTGKDYHLPTEAQWEKAARGGLEGKLYPWGDEIDPSMAHLLSTWEVGPVEVGLYPPNGYGLFDVAGNVFEYTQDWYHETYYSWGPKQDPVGPSGFQAYTSLLNPQIRSRWKGRCRTIRGGSYRGGWDYGDYLTLGIKGRDETPPYVFMHGWVYQEPYDHFDLGFRLAEGGVWR